MHGGIIAVFGGAFDPVHFGHVKPALQLLQQQEIARVVFVPSRLHPHKGRIGDRSGDEHRLAMLNLVVRPPGMVVDTREMRAEAPCYTVDTLREFRAELGVDAPLAFVMGEDAFGGVHCWHDYRRLLEPAHLIVTRRPDCAEPDPRHPLLEASGGDAGLAELARRPAGRVCRFDNDVVAASSTAVRGMLERGEQPRYLIPGTVWSYIRRHRLYGYDAV